MADEADAESEEEGTQLGSPALLDLADEIGRRDLPPAVEAFEVFPSQRIEGCVVRQQPASSRRMVVTFTMSKPGVSPKTLKEPCGAALLSTSDSWLQPTAGMGENQLRVFDEVATNN